MERNRKIILWDSTVLERMRFQYRFGVLGEFGWHHGNKGDNKQISFVNECK